MTLFIIIPTYNAARFIPDALDSILAEKSSFHNKVELVLVDDGSTDETPEVCKSYMQCVSEIKYIRQKNAGVSAARNVGLNYVFEHCNYSDWIGFLDADDIWCKGWPSTIEPYLEEDADIIGTGMKYATANLEFTGERVSRRAMLKGGADTSIAENRQLHFGAYIYRASFLKRNQIRFIPGLNNGEDLMFKYEAFFAADYLFLSGKVLYVYRENEHSITHNYSRNALQHYEPFFLAWNSLIDWVTSRDESQDRDKMLAFAQEKVNCSCIYTARDYCKWHNGSYSDFKCEIVRSFLPKHLMYPIPLHQDLEREFTLLHTHPFLFYCKNYLSGSLDGLKKKIKKFVRKSN